MIASPVCGTAARSQAARRGESIRRAIATIVTATLLSGALAACDVPVPDLGLNSPTSTASSPIPAPPEQVPTADDVPNPPSQSPSEPPSPVPSQTPEAPQTRQPSTSGTASGAAPGVLILDSTVPRPGASAISAGTAMVLRADGYAVTNYHVVESSSQIRATVADTGRTFAASVVGADEAHDVALLKLAGAAGLSTVRIDRDAVAVGDRVAAVGNGGGSDRLRRVEGTLTATQDAIRVVPDGRGLPGTMTGLLRTDAAVVSGYSGGPLLDAQGEVLGMTTAAAAGPEKAGFAIPIAQTLRIADDILAGRSSDTVRIGPRAALGVLIADGRGPNGESGAAVREVTSGGPAAGIAMTSGDVITRFNDREVDSAAALSLALGALRPGAAVTVGWVRSDGSSRTAMVTLGASPLN